MKILTADNMTIWYESLFGDIKALNRCSFSVEEGSLTCIIGVNGAGKTTLFRTVSGVVKDFDGKVTSGRIFFDGTDITYLTPPKIVKLGIGHAPQDRHVFFTLPVVDNLVLGAYVRKMSKEAGVDINRDLEDIFDLFPVLRDRRDQKAGTLSGGEQQMLCIGRALMSRPKLLLLDEPLLGLAPIVIEEILNSLSVLKKTGITILVSEQNVMEILTVADSGLIMDDGYIVDGGSSEALMNSRKIREVFFGGD